MRQVLLQVPRGCGEQLITVARELGASTLTRLEGGNGRDEQVDVLVVTLPNASVGPLIDRAQELGDTEASIPGAGAFAFEPPAGEPPDELVDVTPRSPYEVVLAGQQSAGSWRGFLTYAGVAGVVAWLGLFTETVFLLTASMLIAPFAGPAMNTAISIASGRPGLLRHSLLRYAAGIGLTAAVSALLTYAVGQEVTTTLMASVLTVTVVAVLLPLVAGAAGATYLVQSEHSSLISGAAVGILVAASLAPPASAVGVALALGRLDLAAHAAFLVVLQLAGITVSSVVVLWLYDVRPQRQRFGAEQPNLLWAGLGAAAALVAGLVALQLLTAPFLVQGSLARDAAKVVATTLAERRDVAMLSVEPTVASSALPGEPRILVDVRVERARAAPPTEVLRDDLETQLVERLRRRLPDIAPHVTVTVFDTPEESLASP